MSRTNRKPYTKAKAKDQRCRDGRCPVCKANKSHHHNKQLTLKESLKEMNDDAIADQEEFDQLIESFEYDYEYF
jgi:hypothetical protein